MSLSKFSPSRVAPSSTQTTGKTAWSIYSIRNRFKGSDWLSMLIELRVQYYRENIRIHLSTYKTFYVLLTLAYRPKILSLKIEKIEIFKFISKITFLLIYITSLTFLSRLIASFCFRGTFTWILLWASSETPKQTNLGFFEKLTFLVCVFFL